MDRLFLHDWELAARSHELAWHIVKSTKESSTWRDLDRTQAKIEPRLCMPINQTSIEARLCKPIPRRRSNLGAAPLARRGTCTCDAPHISTAPWLALLDVARTERVCDRGGGTRHRQAAERSERGEERGPHALVAQDNEDTYWYSSMPCEITCR